MWTNAIVDHEGFPSQAALNWSRTSLQTPAGRYVVRQRPFTWLWLYSHPAACCFLFLLLPVLRTVIKCASWVICVVAALAVLRWTNCWLHSCCVPIIAVFDLAPANRLGIDPLSPGWGGCVSMICWCGIGEKDDNEKKWEALRTIYSASCQNRISSSQLDHYTQDESWWVWLQVAGVAQCPAICNKLFRCCLVVTRDHLRFTTAEIAWLSDINSILFEGKDVYWWLSQIIPGKVHETDANNAVMLYS